MSEPPASGYRLVRGLSRFLLGLFDPTIEVVGRENVPGAGPRPPSWRPAWIRGSRDSPPPAPAYDLGAFAVMQR